MTRTNDTSTDPLDSCIFTDLASKNDYFVGVRLNRGNIEVVFPTGYKIPDGRKERQRATRELLSTLSLLLPNSELEVEMYSGFNNSSQDSTVPLAACLALIVDFITYQSFLSPSEEITSQSKRGKIDWGKTFKRIKPVLNSRKQPVYMDFIVRQSAEQVSSSLKNIHYYCLYFAVQKIGWLISDIFIPKPLYMPNKAESINTLRYHLDSTNNDRWKRIILALLEIIQSPANIDEHSAFTFGTYNFHIAWERLVDEVFGSPGKDAYFPRATWHLATETTGRQAPLEPDTIFTHGDFLAVLDAKYYQFGISGNVKDLPGSADINKQITYGDFAFLKHGNNVQNAFLLPFRQDDSYLGPIRKVGTAVPNWRDGQLHQHERIQAILIDTKSLFDWFLGNQVAPRDLLKKVLDS
ncbi:LlaJI family restriction endonuclease [Corynebacterium sp. S7]